MGSKRSTAFQETAPFDAIFHLEANHVICFCQQVHRFCTNKKIENWGKIFHNKMLFFASNDECFICFTKQGMIFHARNENVRTRRVRARFQQYERQLKTINGIMYLSQLHKKHDLDSFRPFQGFNFFTSSSTPKRRFIN